jgi:hypothetical protein
MRSSDEEEARLRNYRSENQPRKLKFRSEFFREK